ncbi:hypothetical protein Tco_1173733 [Tanacetum coccineum]
MRSRQYGSSSSFVEGKSQRGVGLKGVATKCGSSFLPPSLSSSSKLGPFLHHETQLMLHASEPWQAVAAVRSARDEKVVLVSRD